MTKEHKHGPVSLALQWAQGEEHPWLIACDERASYLHLRDYSRRMWIEELFGDLEDDGFHLNRSRLYEPERLSRLVMALAWVYTWLMHVGAFVTKRGWRWMVDRNDRRDRSLVEIGRHWIRRCMTNDDLLRAGLKPYYRPNCPVASTTSLADGVHGQRPANEAVTEAITAYVVVPSWPVTPPLVAKSRTNEVVLRLHLLGTTRLAGRSVHERPDSLPT